METKIITLSLMLSESLQPEYITEGDEILGILNPFFAGFGGN